MRLRTGGAFKMPWPILGKIASAIGGSLLTSAINKSSVDDTNRANKKSAIRQMAFQERLSSTAHQREMQDLKKAGLNPMLSYSGSGASTPTGAMSTSTPYQASNPLEGMEELLMNEEKTQQMTIQNEKLNEDIVNQRANTQNVIQNSKTSEATRQLTEMKTAREAQKIELDVNRQNFEKSWMGQWQHHIDKGLGWGSSALNITKGGKSLLNTTEKLGGTSAKQNDTNKKLLREHNKQMKQHQDATDRILERHSPYDN